jgi:ribose/xylose/arabinose/galactoside ABC-type transport system permease subunit
MVLFWFLVLVLILLAVGGVVIASVLRPQGSPYHQSVGWRLASEGIWAGLILIAGIVPALLVLGAAPGGHFASIRHADLLTNLVLAAPIALLVARGTFDFSIAGTAALCAVVIVFASHSLGDAAPLVGVVLGLVIGLINAAIVTFTRVSPLLITLGIGVAARGIANYLTGGMMAEATLSTVWFGSGATILFVFLSACWVLAIAALALFTRVGREPARPDDRDAALQRLSRLGIPLVLTGTAAGIVSVMAVARFHVASNNLFTGIEPLIALAAVLGGTCFGGRHPMVIGAALAGLAASLITLCLLVFNLPRLDEALIGLALVAGVLASQAYALICNTLYSRKARLAPAFPVTATNAPTDLKPPA